MVVPPLHSPWPWIPGSLGFYKKLNLKTNFSRFKGGIALDSWLFPLKEESELKPPSPEALLFINCEMNEMVNIFSVLKITFQKLTISSWHM